MLTFRTAGESHGPCLTVIIEGVPAGVGIAAEDIDSDLARRQKGYGRGGRMKIETDRAEILGGVRWGESTGAPIALRIENRDWANWREKMSAHAADAGSAEPLTEVRPGHADLAGALKYGHTDARNILERSSARETAGRVAAGAVAKAALKVFDIRIGSFVDKIGGIAAPWEATSAESWIATMNAAAASEVSMPDAVATDKTKALIDELKQKGDTVGGSFICFALGLPVGLGSHVSWTERLEAKIARALFSIPAIKAVEAGIGFDVAELPGSKVHDRIAVGDESDERRGGVRRTSNNAGGLEGGMTNGEPLWVRAAMKPIPTLMQPLETVDLVTREAKAASKERSDVCAVPAAAVVGEAMLAVTLADAFFNKFGPDSAGEAKRNFDAYLGELKRRAKQG